MPAAFCSIPWTSALAIGGSAPMASRAPRRAGGRAPAGGAWQGKQIVPADWVRRIITPAVKIEGARSYGYHWYIYDNMVDGQRQYWVGAIGWGGQRLYAFPGLDLVVAMICGNYRQTGME